MRQVALQRSTRVRWGIVATSDTIPHVLVLGGGPDAEREVSIQSSTTIAGGLNASGRYSATLEIIDTATPAQLAKMKGDVVFPYLHGPWGEGGPLQDILEDPASSPGGAARPFVGSNGRASRAAMDKVATKAVALELGIPTPPVWILNTRDPVCPTRLPVIVKPVHEGSTIGLHVCDSRAAFVAACEAIHEEQARRLRENLPARSYMVEPKVPGREITIGVVDGEALPIIEIRPRDGLYDFEAKYTRDDTEYLFDTLTPTIAKRVSKQTVRLFKALGLRHLARADFMLDAEGVAWLLEINTTPGFTDHSLVPKASRHAGVDVPALCANLADMALRDRAVRQAG